VEREAVFMTGVSLAVGLVVRTAAGDPRAMLPAIEDRLRELDPQGTLFEARTFTQSVDEELAPTRFAASLALVFAILALGLAAVGLYGVIAYSVSQRTRDIGVRIALGAGRDAVLRLVIREGLVLVVPGIILGAAGAYAASRVIESLLYGVSPADIPTFVGVAVVLFVVAGLASYVPARRAARIDPVEALQVR
jgi:putative ABC transport system permease protein